jgi:hypothetical protein
MSNQVTEIRKEIVKGLIEVTRLFEGNFQKPNTMTAELRQEVTIKSYYPSIKVSNNMQDNLFGSQEFGATEQEFESKETRVSWINVPASKTIEEVKASLAAMPQAHLYRVVSNNPIITDDQERAIKNGLRTLDEIAEGQVVRYGEAHEKAGVLILDKNKKIQYRKVFFNTDGTKHDQDLRTADEEMYFTEALAEEYNAVAVENDQTV